MVKKDSREPEKGAIRGFASTVATYTELSVRYTASDIWSRPRNWCIGFLSVFLVVFFTGLILTATSKTTYVLLRFAELQVGEMDALVVAGGGTPFVNYTEIGPSIDSAPTIEGSAPRWLAKGQMVNVKSEKEWLRLNASTRPPLRNISTNVLLIDSSKEKGVGIGRAWPYRQIGFAETQVYHSALRYINVKPNVGERLRLFVDLDGLLSQQGVDFAQITTPIPNPIAGLNTSGEVTVGNVSISTQAILDALAAAGVTGAGNSTNLLDVLNQSFTANIDPLGIIPTDIQLNAADAITEIEGKYPSLLGNMAILDYRDFLDALVEQSCLDNQNIGLGSTSITGDTDGAVLGGATNAAATASPVSTFLDTIKLEEYALLIVAMFKDRFDIYYSGDTERTRRLIKATNDLFRAVGIDFSGEAQYPLPTALAGFYFLQLFLDSVFTTVVVVIAVLGVLLVYMLLVTNSEERQFEVAMIRAQGMTKSQLLHLLITQALAFVIPGIAVAISLLLLVNAIVEIVLEGFTKAPPRTDRIPAAAIIVAVLLGVLVPIIANWSPVRAAMSTSLRDALDIYRQKNNETIVTTVRLAELGLEPWQVFLGVFLTIAGFVIFYIIPLSFIFNNLYLFFLMLNLILLTMLFGLCLLSYSLQGILQKGVLWLMLWGPERKLSTMIKRNFQSHKDRNALTFMMFNISVSAVVFAGVLFTLLAGSLSDTVRIFNGADLTVQSINIDVPLDKNLLESILGEAKAEGTVEAFAFSTFSLREYTQSSGSETVSGVTTIQARSLRVTGVDERLQDAIFPSFVLFSETDGEYSYTQNQGKDDVVRSMYASIPFINNTVMENDVPIVFSGYPENVTIPDVGAKYQSVIPCIMASTAKDILGVGAGSSGILSYEYRLSSQRIINSLYLFQPRALATKVSGFAGISNLPFGLSRGNLLAPIPLVERILRSNDTDFKYDASSETTLTTGFDWDVKYQKVYIKLRPGMSTADRSDFANYIQSQVNPYYHVPLDTQELINTIGTAASLINYFFYFISAVTVILDAFMLWLAFVSNVRAQAWSFGVLRSLGFRAWQLTRAYVYEALCIVISSFFVGAITGIVVAVTITLQLNVFLDLPFTFEFPVGLFFFLLGLSLFAAVVGSIVPSRAVAKLPISVVLRKMD